MGVSAGGKESTGEIAAGGRAGGEGHHTVRASPSASAPPPPLRHLSARDGCGRHAHEWNSGSLQDLGVAVAVAGRREEVDRGCEPLGRRRRDLAELRTREAAGGCRRAMRCDGS